MRTVVAMVIALGMSAAAGAQTIGLPLPEIGLPLPQLGLPLPPMGLPPVHTTAVSSARTPSSKTPPGARHPTNNPRGSRSPRSVVYFVPVAGWDAVGAQFPGPPAEALPPEPAPLTGRLSVDVQPGADARLFIDGYYVGALADVGDGLTLVPGPHHLDIRADGYEPLGLDVQITPDGLLQYRGVLTPLPAAPRDATPLPPTTIYMIPGCYVGNLPPSDVTLPAGCDASRASVFPSRR